MKITRRLFARMAPAAPALAKFASAEAVLTSRGTPTGAWPIRTVGTTFSGGSEPQAGTSSGWDMFRRAFKAAIKPDQLRHDRCELFSGFDPDILSLRSVSAQHRAFMLAKAFRARKEQELSLKNKIRVMAGLNEEIDW